MASFARTTTVRKFNVRDNRKHFGAVVRIVAALPMASLRLRQIARILLAQLGQRIADGRLALWGWYSQLSTAGLAGRPASAVSLRLVPAWRGLTPCPASLPGRF
ncbi:MAG: hypothetical protein ACOX1P_23275 [Thermoguttaceae bacterium]|jgi:hypothetical protein